jgi:hypothetical protein
MKIKEPISNKKHRFIGLALAVSLIVTVGLGTGTTSNEPKGNEVPEGTYSNGPGSIPVTEWIRIDLPWKTSYNTVWSNFTFTWGPDKQKIVNGDFFLNIDFGFREITATSKNDPSMFYVSHDLIIVVEANDDDYNPSDYVGFVFDTNHNGYLDTYDIAYLASADNSSLHACLDDSGFMSVSLPWPSCHGAVFDASRDYTFVYSPFSGDSDMDLADTLKEGEPNLAHVCFYDDFGKGVFIQFQFSIPNGLNW